MRFFSLDFLYLFVYNIKHVYARLAQLVRAPRLHRGGRGFESLSVYIKKALLNECFLYTLSNSIFGVVME